MKKILIKIDNNTLIFKERKKISSDQKSILNTNVISCNELLFSDEYIASNPKIVGTFIEELVKSNNIENVIIENTSIYELICQILKYTPHIKTVIFKEDTPLTYKICSSLIKTNVSNINCYNLQEFMLEILDKNHILVECRSEILFESNFMKGNNLASYSSLFYKITLHLVLPFSTEDEEDFKTFVQINKYLKYIHLNHVSRSDLELIVDILKKNNKKNIKILINENINDLDTIGYLKNYNKRYSKRYKITFKICYSDAYLKENFMKQTNTSILKMCGFIIIFIIALTFGFVFYDNYHSMQKVTNIQNNIKKVIEITTDEDILANLPPIEEDQNEPTKVIINDDIASLLSINPDVVGWLKVNNTNIDYPTVQAKDNKFYLKHNIYAEEDSNGWVFIDHRNNPNELNDNLIVYAHNRYYSGVMFGNLSNTTKYSWYSNEENQILTYRTIYGTYHYKIFSIYKIYKTNDYIATEFTDNKVKTKFFQKLKDRSIYDFKVNLDADDKIITLSTCADENNRIVVHAVLINE